MQAQLRTANVGQVLDTVLDRTVIGGYSKLGYRVRSHGWSDADLRPLDGKVVVITGASSGLGLAAAIGIARLGATLWLAVRDIDRGHDARRWIISESGHDDVHVGHCDLSSLASVHTFAQELSTEPRIDVLINNAGVLTSRREISAGGIELTLATNVIGPFLLTGLLCPQLQQSAPARIINVSSGGMYTRRIQVDDLQSERGEFDGAEVYARTKRAEVILTELWAEQLSGTGVVVHAMHPGWADTAGISAALPRFHRVMRPLLRTADEGADTIVWLASAEQPGTCSGAFWHDRRARPTHLLPGTRETASDRERLWEQCVALSGWHPSSSAAHSSAA
jgi:dehydrogenase/reductase SDR family protein 12